MDEQLVTQLGPVGAAIALGVLAWLKLPRPGAADTPSCAQGSANAHRIAELRGIVDDACRRLTALERATSDHIAASGPFKEGLDRQLAEGRETMRDTARQVRELADLLNRIQGQLEAER